MNAKTLRWFTMIMVLVTLAGMTTVHATNSGAGSYQPNGNGIVNLSGHLVQDKIQLNGDGIFELNLELNAAAGVYSRRSTEKNVDIVLVLDRSGSMQGKKLQFAVQALTDLLNLLSPNDRLSLVSYADDVRRHSPLLHLTSRNRALFQNMIYAIYAGGSTNLGGGLRVGLDTLLEEPEGTRIRKVILISDGLANRGIVDPWALGNMASVALENNFSVATVGVGDSFNEQLMAHIADQGAGTYHYLENPDAFAAVFEHEFMKSRHIAATSLEVHIPKIHGVRLMNAGGFPVKEHRDHYTVYPGNLLAGQSRTLFLRFQADIETAEAYTLKGIWVSYINEGTFYRELLQKPFTVSRAKDKSEVLSSIHKKAWEDKVIKEDYNRLREEVAADVKAGDQERAMHKIETYYQEKKQLNQTVKSEEVEKNLDQDVGSLKSMVRDTFQGSPSAVKQKQKSNAKSLQYEGYKERRNID